MYRLALAVFFVFSMPTKVMATEVSAPHTASTEKTRLLIQQGQFEEALDILRPLINQDKATDTDTLFLFGLATMNVAQWMDESDAMRSALLKEAIASFRAILIEHPQLQRVRLELARAFFVNRDDKLAKRHFEQVLASDDLPTPVVSNIHRFLSEIRARKRWSTLFGFALTPDSNIGAGSEKEVIYIGGLRFERDIEDPITSGTGILVWAEAGYQYPISERIQLLTRGAINRHQYADDQFNRTNFTGDFGPTWFVNPDTEISVLASIRRNWTGNEQSYHDSGLRIETRHRLSRRTTVSMWSSWYDRRHDQQTQLDGAVVNIDFGGAYALTPTVRTNATIGWSSANPEVERWRFTSYKLQLGTSVDLPKGFTVGGNGQISWTNYKGSWFPHTDVGVSRRDITRSTRLSIYNRAISIKGFSPQISVVRESRSTNAQLYDYKRTLVELRFVQLF